MTTTGERSAKACANRIDDLETADRVSDADGPEAMQAGIGVGRKTRALLVAGVDDCQRAVLQLLEQSEDEIAGHAEDVANSLFPEAPDQIVADGLAGGNRIGHAGGPC